MTERVHRQIKRSDGLATRERLVRAGEKLFAAKGIEVPLAEVQRVADLRNNSALHYYFGSRDGLLTAILDRHQLVIETERDHLVAVAAAEGRGSDLRALVEALVVPAANRLRTADGRDYLLILPQVVHRMDVSRADGTMPQALRGTFDRIERVLAATASEARARTGMVAVMNAAVLADRARQINGQQHHPSHDNFVVTLINMLVGALAGAPADHGRPEALDQGIGGSPIT